MCNNDPYEQLLEMVKARRSVRKFKPDPIPDEYIGKIIEVARWAPSGLHTQPWEFVVVKKKDLKDKIVEIIEHKKPTIRGQDQSSVPMTSIKGGYHEAPVFIILLGDWRAAVGLPGPVQGNEDRVNSINRSSLASAFLYMHLAASSLGLASKWCSGAEDPGAQPAIKKLIGIPDELKIYDMMALGYAAQPPIPKPVRKTEDMLHYDDCGIADFRTQAQVEADARETKAWCMSAH